MAMAIAMAMAYPAAPPAPSPSPARRSHAPAIPPPSLQPPRPLRPCCLHPSPSRLPPIPHSLLFHRASPLRPAPGRRPHRRSPLAAHAMLPSAISEPTSGTHASKWSARAIKAFSMAELEARKMKYPTTGTEALLMGILTEGTGCAARYLRAHGITLFGVREETIKLLGKADMYFFSPEHPILTEPAQKALDWAVENRNKSGKDTEVTTTHLVLGIWEQKGSAGQQVLTTLGFDDKNAEDFEAFIKDADVAGKTVLD